MLSGDTSISKAFKLIIQGVTFGRLLRQALIPLYDYLPFAETKQFKEALEKTDRTVLEVLHMPFVENIVNFILHVNKNYRVDKVI